MEDLKQDEPQEKQVTEPSKEKPTEPTSKEGEKPTSVEPKTRTEEEFRKAQSGWTSKITEKQNEIDRLAKVIESYDVELSRLQNEEDERVIKQLGEDPEALEAWKDRKVIAREKAELAKERRQFAEEKKANELLAQTALLATVAAEMNKEYGIPVKDLEDCNTPQEMEIKSLRYARQKDVESKGASETPLRFASNVSAAGGDNWRELSPDEKLRKATKDMKF